MLDYALVCAAAAAAGVVNSVAGGGTLLSFPMLLWIGMPSVMANATNTVALTPGALSSAWGYRRELRGADFRVAALVAPSLVGGVIGAVLLRLTPTEVFDRLVPALIFFATCLFMAQERVQRWLNLPAATPHSGASWLTWAMLYQLVVGLYGGYFGAGIGILMLAVFALMGLTDIHQMNGLKNLLASCINGIAAVYFIWSNLISWPFAAVMAVGAVIGGVTGAGLARRMGRRAVRRIVIGVGFAMTVSLLFRI